MALRGKKILAALGIVIVLLAASMVFLAVSSKADTDNGAGETLIAAETETNNDNATSSKAMAAGIAIGLAAVGGAVSMGIAIKKAMEGISRQPEADGKIRTTLMLGLVFIETAIIYALVVAILIIFVL